MNVFPTRILLASDGSESAAHATEVAVELSKKTYSELHVLYVGEYSATSLYPQAADPAWVVQENLAPIQEQGQQFEQLVRQTLDAEVQQVRAVGGDGCAGAFEDGNASGGDREGSRGSGGGAGSCREPRFGWDQEGFARERR
ncbi:MAG: hypothetical protein AVDCRST_MAG78-1375 [uncultured Rubrobacteraceae bacterium]|uniref:UspA domain-containing protein n=1 Tax=uncultured Rubrobacteraceae bacterium TaxID=349277 RepID=A0A6J4PZS7_9ACTN|nr:MAG: hypothetical protein AVDCRST_MAG78-1375 [uncultured Rubrobacteraceae bacterium]